MSRRYVYRKEIKLKKKSRLKKKFKCKWNNIILAGLFVIFLSILLFSSYKIINRLIDKNKTDMLLSDINSMVTINSIDDIIDINDIEVSEGLLEEKIDYYYEYLKIPFMSVEFSKLREINKEVVGWINVVGAEINYPYVQTTNNDYYLYYSFDKTKNDGGWVFLDCRNNKNNRDQNTIIYAHGGNTLALFGLLKNLYNKSDWFNNKDNHYIKISTEEYNLVYKVFSLYVIPTTSDYLQINFDDNDTYQKFLDKLINRSKYDFEVEVDVNDKIITLSTCYNKKEKLVLHGKLIKEDNK